MGKYRRKTDRSLKVTTEVMYNSNRSRHTGEGKRSIAGDLGVHESTLRKRLKLETVPTPLGRFKATFSNEEDKKLADYCRDLVALFYGLTIRILKGLAFEYADRSCADNRFNKEKKNVGKDVCSCSDGILRKRICHELCSEAPVRTLPLISDTGCMNTCNDCSIFRTMSRTGKLAQCYLFWINTFPIAA